MRKLKLQVQMTIDGYVAGPNGELDWMWIGKPDEAILQMVIELAGTCDTILLGRKMTPGFIDYWENMVDNETDNIELPLAKQMVSMHKIVFSRTETNMKGRNLVVESKDPVSAVEAMKKQNGKDIMVYGGATFVRFLIEHNLVDEYYIFRRPVAIGNGLSIFVKQRTLELDSCITYKNGAMLHKYLPV